jgi:polyisoprenoid-binding protein YceI
MSAMPTLPPALRRHRSKIIGAVIAVLLVAVVGPWVYLNVIQDDAPDKPSVDDISASVDSSTSTSAAPGGTAPSGTTVDEGTIDGTWTVQQGDEVFAGYRTKEVLFGQDAEAVGRTPDVAGTLTATGTTISAVDITVDMTTVQSSESRRDGQFNGRIMSTSQFPTATFHLTEPIDLGTLPADGAKVTVEATGRLTLRGVTKTVTVELEAKRQSGTLVVSGSADIDFDDFDIPDASSGPASVGRSGQLELLLVFVR